MRGIIQQHFEKQGHLPSLTMASWSTLIFCSRRMACTIALMWSSLLSCMLEMKCPWENEPYHMNRLSWVLWCHKWTIRNASSTKHLARCSLLHPIPVLGSPFALPPKSKCWDHPQTSHHDFYSPYSDRLLTAPPVSTWQSPVWGVCVCV